MYPQDAWEAMHFQLQSVLLIQNRQPAMKSIQYNNLKMLPNGALATEHESNLCMEVLVYQNICWFNVSMDVNRHCMLMNIFKTSCWVKGNLHPIRPWQWLPSWNRGKQSFNIAHDIQQQYKLSSHQTHVVLPEPRKCWLKLPFSINSYTRKREPSTQYPIKRTCIGYRD